MKRDENGKFKERFFVLTHSEIGRIQAERNAAYGKKYRAKYGKRPDPSKGVDNVTLAEVEKHEDAWSKITKKMAVD